MFDNVKDFFRGDAKLNVDNNGQPTTKDLVLACCAILIEASGQDSHFAKQELETMFGLLNLHFGLDPKQSRDTLAAAEAMRAQRGKIDEFVNSINKSFDKHQRQQVLAMIWRVVLADGKVDKAELRFVTQLKFRLMLDDKEAEHARKIAEDQIRQVKASDTTTI